MNLTQQLFDALPVILEPVGAKLGLNSDPLATYPIVTYNLITQSAAAGNANRAFDSEAETFTVQVTVFDDDDQLLDLIQTQAEAEGLLKDRSAWEALDIGFVGCTYAGGFGPVYNDTERYWQYSKDFVITLAKAKGEADV